jgi:Uncharacterised protein family UPF0547
MTLTNYRQQTERVSPFRTEHSYLFTCQACASRWTTPKRVYKTGFLVGALVRVTHWVHLAVPGIGWLQKASEAGQTRFSAAVEREAVQLAQAHYLECPGCHRAVCPSCQDGERCVSCAGQSGAGAVGAAAPAARRGPSCPACNTASDGGRFCPECGFDLAATYKSCPSCAAQLPRASNFCPDCGHSF